MSIWEYADPVKSEDALKCAAKVGACPFCLSNLISLAVPEYLASVTKDYVVDIFNGKCWFAASGCGVCGWWRVVRNSDWDYPVAVGGTVGEDVDVAAGALKCFDISDVGAPVEEVRNYLVARYDARYNVHPRVFEETVASVFHGLGYRARVTGYSNDGGIDVILDSPSSTMIGVQVKRYRNTIKVESIRSLAGALVLNDCTEGVFVTTSDFQSGCQSVADLFAVRGIPIQLLNAERFYDALCLVERAIRFERRDWLPSISEEMFRSVGDKRMVGWP